MRQSYMPAKQAEQVQWANTFNTVVGAEAVQYGVPVVLMAQFDAANTALQSAWQAACEPSTRTRGIIAAKDLALQQMKTLAKQMVSIIQGTPGVTPQMLIDAGLTVRKTHPTPKPAPSEKPVLVLKKLDGRIATLELRQQMDKRAKPTNATGAMLFIAYGDAAPLEPSGWTFYSVESRTTTEIDFGASATAGRAWVTAFWTGTRKETSPAANPIMIDLPAGGTLPQEADQAPMLKAA